MSLITNPSSSVPYIGVRPVSYFTRAKSLAPSGKTISVALVMIAAIGALMIAGAVFAGALAGKVPIGGVLFGFGMSGAFLALAVCVVKVATKRWPKEKLVDRALAILDTHEDSKVDPKFAAELPVKNLERALKLADKSTNKSDALLGIVRTHVKAARSKEDLHKALQVAEKIEDTAIKVKALTSISVASFKLGLDVEKGSIDFPDLDHQARYCRDTAIAYASRGLFDKALTCVDAIPKGQDEILAEALQGIAHELGNRRSSRNDYTSLLEKVLTKAREAISRDPVKVRVLVGIAKGYAKVNNREKAKEVLEEASNLVKKAEKSSKNAMLESIALGYVSIGYVQEAFGAANKLTDLGHKAWVYCDIGQKLITFGRSHFQSALKAFQESVKVVNLLSVGRGLHADIGGSLLNVVTMLAKCGRLEDARKIVDIIASLKGQESLHIEALITVAKADVEGAQSVLVEALTIAGSLPANERIEAWEKVVEASITIDCVDNILPIVESSLKNGFEKIMLVFAVYTHLLTMVNAKTKRPLKFYQDAHNIVTRMAALMPQIAEAHLTYQTTTTTLVSELSESEDTNSLGASLRSQAGSISQDHARIQTVDIPVSHAVLLGEIARGHFAAESVAAREIFSKALETARAIPDPAGKAQALRRLGDAYRKIDLELAKKVYLEAFKGTGEIENPSDRASAQIRIGYLYYLFVDFKTTEYPWRDRQSTKMMFPEALESARKITDREEQMTAFCDIGRLYGLIDHKIADKVFKEAVDEAVFSDAFAGNTQHRDYIVERLLAEDPIDIAKLS